MGRIDIDRGYSGKFWHDYNRRLLESGGHTYLLTLNDPPMVMKGFPKLNGRSVRENEWCSYSGEKVPAGYVVIAGCGDKRCVDPKHALVVRREWIAHPESTSNVFWVGQGVSVEGFIEKSRKRTIERLGNPHQDVRDRDGRYAAVHPGKPCPDAVDKPKEADTEVVVPSVVCTQPYPVSYAPKIVAVDPALAADEKPFTDPSGRRWKWVPKVVEWVAVPV